jgi:signal transduction histidine kinase
LWLESNADWQARYPQMAAIRQGVPFQSIAILPLTSRERVVGILAFSFRQARRFSPEERDFLWAVTRQCGQALERARLYEAEQQAVGRVTRLQRVTAALSQALTPDQVVDVILNEAVPGARAAAGLVMLITANQSGLEAAAWTGYRSEAESRWRRVQAGAADELRRAIRQGETVFVSSRGELSERLPQIAAVLHETPYEAWALLPIRVEGEVAGALGFSYADVRTFTTEERDFLVTLAQQGGQALERARLYARLEERVQARTLELRALMTRFQTVREDEQRRLAREIHDQLGGLLTGLKMEAAQIRRVIPDGETRLLEKLQSFSGSLDGAVKAVRQISAGLRPSILDDFGLVTALEWQLAEFGKSSGLTCRFHSGLERLDLDETGATAIFRSFQETLTNIARHAHATEVEVSLEPGNGYAVLRVHDNGRGISPEQTTSIKSLGLAGIRERVRTFSGEFTIAGVPGQGTTVFVKIPLTTQSSPTQLEPHQS